MAYSAAPSTGRQVRDASTYFQLLDGSSLSSTGDSGWLEKGLVHEATLHVELGTCTGTGTSMVLSLLQADDSSGTNPETLAILATADQDDDDKEAKALVYVNKPYVKVAYTIAGTTPVFPTTATLRLTHDHRGDNYTGVWS